MVFLNKKYWEVEKPVYPLLQKLAEGHKYGELLAISDNVTEIVKSIYDFTKTQSM